MIHTKQPIKKIYYDERTRDTIVILTFDNEKHLDDWMQAAYAAAYAKAKSSVLKDLQESARLLVKDIFGVELKELK